MKEKLIKLLDYLWVKQYKFVPYLGNMKSFGYHCKGCAGGDDPGWCGTFYCPVETRKEEQMKRRFKNNIILNLLDKWKTSILSAK
jgi:hypothetical protein